MRFSSVVVLLLAIAALSAGYKHAAHVHPTAAPPQPLFSYAGCPVTEVNSADQLRDLLATDQPFLVNFYSDHSVHSKELVDPLIAAARQLGSEARVLALDSTVHANEGAFSLHGIKKYPTLLFFRHGSLVEPHTYEEGHETEQILTFVREFLKSSMHHALYPADVYKIKDAQLVVYLDSHRAAMLPEINRLADAEHLHHRVIEVTDAAVAASLGLKPAPSLAVFRATAHTDHAQHLIPQSLLHTPAHNANAQQHHPTVDPASPGAGQDDKRPPTASYDLLQTHTMQQLREWIALQEIPLLGEIDHDNFHTYLQADLPMFWFFTNNARPEATWENFQKVLTPFAEKYRGRVAFVGGHNYLSHTQKMHLSGIHFPSACLVVHQPHTANTHLANPAKYPMAENLELHEWPRAIQEHLDKFFGGQLRPHSKSQDPPRQNPGPVLDVVGLTFEQMVTHNNKDVIVMFYAPWGQHSDYLKPIYEELAAQLEPVTSLQFLRFDATENDWPRAEFPVHGYPALFFYKAHKGKPVAFHGNLTHDLIYNFIRHHSSGTSEQFKLAAPFDQTAKAVLDHVDSRGIWSVFRSESADFSARIHRILREFRRRHRALMKQAVHYGFYYKTGKDGLSHHDHPLHLADLHDHLDHDATEEDELKHLEENTGELDHEHATGDEEYEHTEDKVADAIQHDEAREEMDYFDETHAEEDHLGEDHDEDEDENAGEHDDDEGGEHHDEHDEHHADAHEGHEEHDHEAEL